MPGEEQEDVVMTSTEVGLLNTVCPISGKSVTELSDPVRRYLLNSMQLSINLLLIAAACGFYVRTWFRCLRKPHDSSEFLYT